MILICTACGKPHADVYKMIMVTPGINLCDECINLCVHILHDDIDGSGLVTVTTGELAKLQQDALELSLARTWIGAVRNSMDRADEVITKNREPS